MKVGTVLGAAAVLHSLRASSVLNGVRARGRQRNKRFSQGTLGFMREITSYK